MPGERVRTDRERAAAAVDASALPVSASARRGLVAIANACMCVFGVVLLLMGSLLPSMQVNDAQAGQLGSFPLAGILLATLLVGPALDLLGARPILVGGLLLTALPIGCMPLLHAFWPLAMAAFLYGVGGGILNTAINALVADLYPSGKERALNLLAAFFSVGAVGTPLLMASVGASLSVATVLRLLAGLIGLILIPALLLPFPAPSRAGARLPDLLHVLRNAGVWMFGLLLFFESGNENTMFVWAGRMARGALQVSAREASLALVALSVALGAGRLLAAGGSRRLGGRNTIFVSCGLMLAGVAVCGLAPGFETLVTGLLLIGTGMAAIFPTTLGIASQQFPRDTGTVFGAIMTVALIGGTLGPTVSGHLAAHGARLVLVMPAMASVAVSLLLWRGTRPVA